MLQIISHFITYVSVSIFVWFVGDLKKIIDLPLVQSSTSSELGQPFVGGISCLIYNIDIKIFCLFVKERLGKGLPSKIRGRV